jgi:hypothetical protein
MALSIIEIPIKTDTASVVPAHPPKIAEDGAPSSWVHKRKGKNKGWGARPKNAKAVKLLEAAAVAKKKPHGARA